MTTGFEKIKKVMFDLHDEIESLEDCDLGELVLGFMTDYRYCGFEINYNILSVNFPGTHDECYMIAIPNDELTTFKKKLDSYPIYFVNFEQGTVEKRFCNYREFMQNWFPTRKILNVLSKKSINQVMPSVRKLDEKETQHYLSNRPAEMDIEKL